MKERQFVIAYDLGTSGVKVALVTMDGEVFGTATADYPLYVEQENWAEQDSELYWVGVCKGTKEALAKYGVDPANVQGLAFGTQWKGIIPVDKNGKVLRNSIIWLDSRAGDQAKRLNEHFGKEMFCAGDYWPKLMWLRENCPEIYEEAEVIHEANSFLKWKATGECAMDITNCFVRSFDPELQQFYSDILDFAGLELSKFPKWVHSHALVGRVTEGAAEEMGLLAGTPVFGGCGDIPAMAIGSGGSHIYMGTSGWIAYNAPHESLPSDLPMVSPFDETTDITESGMNAVCLAFNWAVNRFYMGESAELQDGVFEIVNKDVAEIPAGSEGLIAMPWFYGECEPLNEKVRGTFINLGAQHDRRHMVRAVMEGICYSLKIGDDLYRELKGYDKPKELAAIGGGTLSAVWMQMMADILNTTIHVPAATKHTGAIGTAYCALVGLGVCKDFSEVAQKITIEHTYTPNPETVRVYESAFARFKKLYDVMVPLYSAQ